MRFWRMEQYLESNNLRVILNVIYCQMHGVSKNLFFSATVDTVFTVYSLQGQMVLERNVTSQR